MSQLTNVQELLRVLRLTETASHLPILVKQAETNEVTYLRFLYDVLRYEQHRREEKLRERRLKWASHQLRELSWLDQLFNLILLGPPGVGKTHLAIGLGIEAIHQGYKVTFITMGELIQALKTEEITRKSQIRLQRLRESNLVIIDDLMFIAMDQREANLFFHLINDLYNQSSIILTSNKGPSEWGELLGDPAITTAVLDRIIHRAEVIHLNGDSYRMKHRISIFSDETVQN